MKTLEKNYLLGDLSNNALDYFLVKEYNLTRLYLLSKIQKRLHDVPGRPVISNCGYYTEIISLFLDYHLQSLAQKIKTYIKAVLYPSIPHSELFSKIFGIEE